MFKLNIESYPKSWNVYDSLADAYVAAGNKELAIINYETSIRMNPENKKGAEKLKALRESK